MQISLGFVIVLILILFPGLLFRRLFFYGEFSKQFSSGRNLINLIAVSSVPGIINLGFIFVFYDSFITPIDLGDIIDTFKDIINPNFRSTRDDSTPIKELLKQETTPFISFLYISVIIFGLTSGRLLRITRLDTKFKLLRFKNYWFYLFNGQHTSFRKMKHLKQKNSKHLFTKADILIESNNKTHLYSGIVVDYTLKLDDCETLSKLVLQNVERYSLKEGKIQPVKIPGNIFVVDCLSMKNINLTFIYRESEGVLKSKLPYYTDIIIALLIIFLVPVFIFQADVIKLDFYSNYFDFSWYRKIIAFLLTTQLISLFNPFIKKHNEYKFVNFRSILARLMLVGFFSLLLLLIK